MPRIVHVSNPKLKQRSDAQNGTLTESRWALEPILLQSATAAKGIYFFLGGGLPSLWTTPPTRVTHARPATAAPPSATQWAEFQRRFGPVQFAVLHGNATLPALSDICALPGIRLVVVEDIAVPCRKDGAALIAQFLQRYSPLPPNLPVLVINPRRNRDGAQLDEMDCFDGWERLSPRWRWAHIASPAERNEVVAQVFATFKSSASRPAPDALPSSSLGADWVGVREEQNLRETIRKKTLFRHYGINRPRLCEDLENTFRAQLDSPFTLAVSSGSAALICAVAALGLKAGDEVILPTFSWFSCYNAIIQCNAVPVFCEIDASLNLDPDDLERRISPRTRAVMVVHYQGGPARMDAIIRVAARHRLKVIEDCAQALGGTYRGRPLGSLGDIGTFSFQTNKVLSCGEGGALVCRDREFFERAVRYHDLGTFRPVFEKQTGAPPLTPAFPGNQYRMSEITAAVALAQMSRLKWIIDHCREHSRGIRAALAQSCPKMKYRITGDDSGDSGITIFTEWADARQTERVARILRAQGVMPGASSGMVNLLHTDYVRSGARLTFSDSRPSRPVPRPRDFPHTQAILAHSLPVAIGPRFRASDVARIVAAFRVAYDRIFP